MGWGVLRVARHRAFIFYRFRNHELMLLLNELFVQADLIQREEPLLFYIVGITKQSEHSLVSFDLKHMDPAITWFLRRRQLNWTILAASASFIVRSRLIIISCRRGGIIVIACTIVKRQRARYLIIHLPSRILVLWACSLVLSAYLQQGTKRDHIVRLVRAAWIVEIHDCALVIQVENEESLDKFGQVQKGHRLLLLLLHESSLKVPWYLLTSKNCYHQ